MSCTELERRTVAAMVVVLAACNPRSRDLSLGDVRTLSTPTSVGAAPILAVSANGDEAAAWVSAPDGGTDGRLYVSINDRDPVVIADSLGPIEAHGEAPPKLAYGADGALYALYVVGKVVPDARFPLAALRLTRSDDGGTTWARPVGVTGTSGDFGSHNFHALHVAPDGTVLVSWLGDAPAGETRGDHSHHGGSATWIVRSSDRGESWSRPVRVDVGEACPCCRTALASSPDGALYIAWRSVLPGNIRDVVVARSEDLGSTWGAPVRVRADDWMFEGCPHAGPSMQVDRDGRVHIAWWTGKSGEAGVWYARSDDGARSFTAAVPLGVASFSRPAHVQLALGDSSEVIAVWEDGTMPNPPVVARISRDGGRTWSPRAEVGGGEGRWTGFPVLAVSKGDVTVAWAERSAESVEREAKSAPDMRDPEARMGLNAVGDAQVNVRRGKIR